MKEICPNNLDLAKTFYVNLLKWLWALLP